MNDLVSIIMPSYNSASWILEAIASVKNQTYRFWELLISDDGSDDNTAELVEEEIKKDARIHIIRSKNNQGAAAARNRALKAAAGRYIAYLDSDDLWMAEKLDLQLKFMSGNNYGMCYTSYLLVNENGEHRKTIHVPEKATYDSYLKRPITCTHSILFDSTLVDRELLIMPDIKRGQDGAAWLQVLKTGITGHGLDIPLAKYRRHEGSLSNNKLKAIRRMWYLYREVEKLPLWYACYCFASYSVNALKKYI